MRKLFFLLAAILATPFLVSAGIVNGTFDIPQTNLPPPGATLSGNPIGGVTGPLNDGWGTNNYGTSATTAYMQIIGGIASRNTGGGGQLAGVVQFFTDDLTGEIKLKYDLQVTDANSGSPVYIQLYGYKYQSGTFSDSSIMTASDGAILKVNSTGAFGASTNWVITPLVDYKYSSGTLNGGAWTTGNLLSYLDNDVTPGEYDMYGIRITSLSGAGDVINFDNVQTVPAFPDPFLSYLSATNSGVNGNGNAEPGETFSAYVTLKNRGAVANGVTATVTSASSSYFTVSGGAPVNFGTIARNSTGKNSTGVNIAAASNTPPGNYTFNVTSVGASNGGTASGGAFTVKVSQVVFASPGPFNLGAAVGAATNATLVITNKSSILPLICNFSTNASWLMVSPSSITIPPKSTANITLNAGPYPSEAHLEGIVSAVYSIPAPGFTSFLVNFDVGPRISYLTNRITEISGGFLANKYEPGERLTIAVSNINNGAADLINITNSLIAANPALFTILPLSSQVYASMMIGAVSSTLYQVDISPSAPDGTQTFKVVNSAGTAGTWTNTFTLNIFSRAAPSVSPSTLTINVPATGTATGTITLTNAGNKSATFALTDNGAWPISYSVQKQTASLVSFPPIYDEPDTNTTFTTNTWSGDSSKLLNIGFNFPFYGATYTNFSVSRYGALSFGTTVGASTNTAMPSGTNPVVAPFWGNTAVDTNSVPKNVRYLKQSDKLVVAWGNNQTGHEFQAWIYTNGNIRYLYEQATWGDGAIGVQNASSNQTVNYTPGSGSESILLMPQSHPWVTPNLASGTVNAFGSRIITYTVNAAGLPAETTNTFNATVTWGDGSTSVVALTVVVYMPYLDISVPPRIRFGGPAGAISKTMMSIENNGDVALAYTITDTNAQAAGYKWTNRPFADEFINWDSYSGVLILTNSAQADEGVSVLTPIGFEFPYYGTIYTNLSVGVNGGISLGAVRRMTSVYMEDINSSATTVSLVTKTNTLSTATPITLIDPSQSIPSFVDIPDHFIAPYWRDLVYDDNSVIHVSGDGNKLVVTWVNLHENGNARDQTFQTVLYKNGTIRFQYYSIGGGSNVWPLAEIGLRDTTRRTTNATLVYAGTAEDPGTVTYATNYVTVTNWQRWDGAVTNIPLPDYDIEVIKTNGTNVVVSYKNTVTDEAIVFTPKNPIIISADPVSGILPVGGSQVVNIYGDARSLTLTPGGGKDVLAETTFGINHLGLVPGTNVTTNVVGGVTNITTNVVIATVSTLVPVEFTATNSVETSFADTDADGMSDLKEWTAGTDANSADSIFGVSVSRNADGSRTISWPKANDRLSRTYAVWYTTNLLSGWTELYRDDNFTSYTDTAHPNVPVIYYKVTVE